MMRVNNSVRWRFVGIAFSALLASATNTYAIQNLSAKDGDTLKVKISSKDVTRVAIKDGRIAKVSSADGVLEIKADMDVGEVLIKPSPGAPNVLSFFVRDMMGSTYTVVAEQYDVPSETIVIKPIIQRNRKSFTQRYRQQPFVEDVKSLMKTMATDASNENYDVEERVESVRLWAEAKIELRRIYTGDKFVGEIYSIANVSKSEVVFHEREFMDFGDNVQAVALDRLTLQPGASTQLYVVRLLVEGE